MPMTNTARTARNVWTVVAVLAGTNCIAQASGASNGDALGALASIVLLGLALLQAQDARRR
jgi:hypothetical protein